MFALLLTAPVLLAAQGPYIVGQPVELMVTVENPTELPLKYTVLLFVNDTLVNRAEVEAGPESSATVKLSWTPGEPGTYELRVEVKDEAGSTVKSETYEIEVVSPPMPDLSVKNVSIEPSDFEPGYEVLVRVTVINTGDAPSSGTQVLVKEEPTGRVIYLGPIGPIPEGGAIEVAFHYVTPTEPGNYSLMVELDPDDLVEEGNESNTFTLDISVPSPAHPTERPAPPTTPPPPTSPSPTTGPAHTTTGPPAAGGGELKYWYLLVPAALAASAVGYAAFRASRAKDPCSDVDSLKRSLEAARADKSDVLARLTDLRSEIERASREVDGLESKAEGLSHRLRGAWRELDRLRFGAGPKAVLILDEGKVVVSLGDRLAKMRELHVEVREGEERLSDLRSKIVDLERGIDAKLRLSARLWSEAEEANERAREATDTLFECLLKKKGDPCYDLQLLRERVADLTRELEAARDLADLSKEDVARIERMIRQLESEVESERRVAEFWEEAAEKMRLGEPSMRVKVGDGPELTDIDLRLLQMEENDLAIRFSSGEISEREFVEAYRKLSPPDRDLLQSLRDKIPEAIEKMRERADSARRRADELVRLLPSLRGALDAATSRTTGLEERVGEITRALEKAQMRLEKCEKRLKECLSDLTWLRWEVRSGLRNYGERKRKIAQEAMRELEAIDAALAEAQDLAGRVRQLVAEINRQVEKITPVAALERMSPEFQKLIEDDWNAFTYGKTAGSLAATITQLVRDLGAKADSVVPDPSDYLEPAVKGAAFAYRVAGVLLSPTEDGAWLRRALRVWGKEGRIPSDEDINRVLEAANRFRGAWVAWRGELRGTLEALERYLRLVKDARETRGEWQSFLECVEGLPSTPIGEVELRGVEQTVRESEGAKTLEECEKYRELLKEANSRIRERAKDLLESCERPAWAPSSDLDSARGELLERLRKLREISSAFRDYLESVGSFLRSIEEDLPPLLRAIYEVLKAIS